MKKDIPFLPVQGISIAIAREKNELNAYLWNVYLLNKNDFILNNILISSKGYGTKDGEMQQTSILRHHFPELAPGEHIVVEPIDPGIFHLNNEYWVSYFVNNQIFDKKFIFLTESIIEENLIFIPELNMEGILHN
jgi:hypothetical protein